jgi:hypothetical protein
MDAGFFPSSNPSVGRQEPNPEADAVWEEWELSRPIVVTAEELRRMGKDPSVVTKLDDDVWHLGDDAYVTIMGTAVSWSFNLKFVLTGSKRYISPAALPRLSPKVDLP